MTVRHQHVPGTAVHPAHYVACFGPHCNLTRRLRGRLVVTIASHIASARKPRSGSSVRRDGDRPRALMLRTGTSIQWELCSEPHIQAHHVHNGVRAQLSCLLEEREDLINGTLVPVSDTTTVAVL